MPNINHYIDGLGNEPFSELAFNALDSLAFTQIVYMPMEGLLDGGGTATIAELWAFFAKAISRRADRPVSAQAV